MNSLQKLISLKHQIDQLKDTKLKFKDICLILQDTLNKLDITNDIVDQFVKSNDPQNTTFGKIIRSLFTNESIDVVDFLLKLFKIDSTKHNNEDKQQ